MKARLDTGLLIDRLAEDAAPVKRLPPAWKRVAFWLALALPPLVAIVAFHGLSVDGAAILSDRRLMIEQIAALLTAVTAAGVAFASTVPGADRRWMWLPAAPLAVWLLALGRGCIDDWIVSGPAGLALRSDFECLGPMTLMAIVPAALMLVMVRRGAALTPRLTLFMAALATAALVAFGLRFFHIGDASIMVLVWHMGLAAILSAAACLSGPRLFGWRSAPVAAA